MLNPVEAEEDPKSFTIILTNSKLHCFFLAGFTGKTLEDLSFAWWVLRYRLAGVISSRLQAINQLFGIIAQNSVSPVDLFSIRGVFFELGQACCFMCNFLRIFRSIISARTPHFYDDRKKKMQSCHNLVDLEKVPSFLIMWTTVQKYSYLNCRKAMNLKPFSGVVEQINS